jgi:hypothetical protein
MSRLGVIYNFDFDVAEKHLLFPPGRLSSNYLINQASARLAVELKGIPVVAECGLTSSSGLFGEAEREQAIDSKGEPVVDESGEPVTENIPSLDYSRKCGDPLYKWLFRPMLGLLKDNNHSERTTAHGKLAEYTVVRKYLGQESRGRF